MINAIINAAKDATFGTQTTGELTFVYSNDGQEIAYRSHETGYLMTITDQDDVTGPFRRVKVEQ